MINDRRFFYKAKRYEDGKEVIGRVGCPHSTNDGKEVTTYFNEYIGDTSEQANWKSCIVITDSIRPLDYNYLRVKIEQLIENFENSIGNRDMNDLEQGKYDGYRDILDLLDEMG